MITKCANPDCRVEFRYSDKGQLFAYEIRNLKEPCHDVPAVICERKPGRATVYFWLCAPCSTRFTLQFTVSTGLQLVPLALDDEGDEERSLATDPADNAALLQGNA